METSLSTKANFWEVGSMREKKTQGPCGFWRILPNVKKKITIL